MYIGDGFVGVADAGALFRRSLRICHIYIYRYVCVNIDI